MYRDINIHTNTPRDRHFFMTFFSCLKNLDKKNLDKKKKEELRGEGS